MGHIQKKASILVPETQEKGKWKSRKKERKTRVCFIYLRKAGERIETVAKCLLRLYTVYMPRFGGAG